MTDYLTREFTAQLTTTMDSVLRRAVFEITRLFERSLHDHQMELVQKGEEIAQLRIKLQAAEIRLRERECGGDGLEDMNKTQMIGTQGELEVCLNPSGPTSDVPEIDFEVPDDWCAPLGSEMMIKQDDDVCPSVRLRPLMIPLWRIPVIKQEEADRNINSHQQTNRVRKSRRGFPLNRHKRTQDQSAKIHDQRTRRKRVRQDMRNLLRDIKQEYCDQTGSMGLRRRGNSTGKEQENAPKSRKEEGKITATESEPTGKQRVGREKNREKRYTCKFCKKVFDTAFGRSVHLRFHRRCRGCKKEFPFPSILTRHKLFCKNFKKLLAKEALCTNPPKTQAHNEETLTKKQVIMKKGSSSSSSIHTESSIQKGRSSRTHCCAQCGTRFISSYRLKQHMCAHAGEKPFPCSMSQKKFHINQSLKNHKMRKHQDQMNSSETNLTWAKPVDSSGDNGANFISPRKDTKRTINLNKVKREHSSDVKLTDRWQTMGVQYSDGFCCSVCQKFLGNKYMLIEHFRIHTGERPLKCEWCHERFRTRQQLCTHRKRCSYPVTMIQCDKSEKRFQSKAKYNKHVPDCREDWPNVCKVCGKGFLVKGCLRNHMARYHN